jgi:hypothetical protein
MLRIDWINGSLDKGAGGFNKPEINEFRHNLRPEFEEFGELFAEFF